MSTTKDDIETKLMGSGQTAPPSKSSPSLIDKKPKSTMSALEEEMLLSSDVGKNLFFDEDGLLSAPAPKVEVLEGVDALRFLGLPENRTHGMLKKGDCETIHRKFSRYIENSNRKGKGEDLDFWSKISVRVWNKKNIGEFTSGGNLSEVEPARYVGDVFDGRCLHGFLSSVANSTRSYDFVIQLLSVKVTEDLKNYG